MRGFHIKALFCLNYSAALSFKWRSRHFLDSIMRDSVSLGGFVLIQPLVALHKHIGFFWWPSGFVYERAVRLYQRDKHKLAYTHRESSTYCTLRHIDMQLEICIFSACTRALYNVNCRDTCHNISCNHMLNTSSFFIPFSVFVSIFPLYPLIFVTTCLFVCLTSPHHFPLLSLFVNPHYPVSVTACLLTNTTHTHTHSLLFPPLTDLQPDEV